jgi:hypothetical protein
MNWISQKISWIKKISLCLHKICGLWHVTWFCFSFFSFWKLVELWNCVLVCFVNFQENSYCDCLVLLQHYHVCSIEPRKIGGEFILIFLVFLEFLVLLQHSFLCVLEFKKLESLFIKSLFSIPLCYWFIDLNTPMRNWTSLEA